MKEQDKIALVEEIFNKVSDRFDEFAYPTEVCSTVGLTIFISYMRKKCSECKMKREEALDLIENIFSFAKANFFKDFDARKSEKN